MAAKIRDFFSMPIQHDKSGASECLTLNCSRRELTDASISHGTTGTVYRCRCGPLTDGELADLERAAAGGQQVRLLFTDASILLTGVTLRRVQPGFVEIEGRLVRTPAPRRPEGAHAM